MSAPDLLAFAGAVAAGDIEVVDLTHTLTPEFPTIVMPPELGQCAPFRMEEVSRYDERGSAWYWNNISMGEHTGTHFDAPVHWISGKDLANNSVDTIPAANSIAPAAVIDISRQSAANADYELTVADVTAWEAQHGRISPRSWVLLRTDWSKRADAESFFRSFTDDERNRLRATRRVSANGSSSSLAQATLLLTCPGVAPVRVGAAAGWAESE